MTPAASDSLFAADGDDDGVFPYISSPDAAIDTVPYGDDELFPSYSSPHLLGLEGREHSDNSALLPFSSSPPFALLTPSAPSTPSAGWDDAAAALPANPFVSSPSSPWTIAEDGFDATASPLSPAASVSPPRPAGPTPQSAVASPAHETQRKRKPKCQSACVPCRTAKTACDGQRPCTRCVTQRKLDGCVDRPQEEIERGKLRKKRKARRPPAPPLPTPGPAAAAAAAVEADESEPSSFPVPSAILSMPASVDQSAVTAAAYHAARLRERLVAYVEAVERTVAAGERRRALRHVHMTLAHFADVSLANFDAFINGVVGREKSGSQAARSAPSSAAGRPLPRSLQCWSRPETRPLYFDWHQSPVYCLEDDADGEQAVPTISFDLLPAARLCLQKWEEQVKVDEEQQQQQQQTPSSPPEDASALALEALFQCLAVDDSVPVSAEQAKDEGLQPPTHAAWCDRHQLQLSASPAASVPVCVCSRSIAVPASMVVNRSWERLLGWSQEEVRRQLLQHGSGFQSMLFRPDSWFAFQALVAAAVAPERSSSSHCFSTFAIVRNKWQHETSCLVKKEIVTRHGFTSSRLRFHVIAAAT